MQGRWQPRGARCSFVPPYVLDHLARVTGAADPEPSAAQRTAVVSKRLREQRRRARAPLAALLPADAKGRTARRKVYDCQGRFENAVELVRAEGDPPVQLDSANAAYDSSGATRDYYAQVHGRAGIDDAGSDLLVDVNYGVAFDNAFWDGTRIVLGTGDGVVFTDLSKSPEVMGHELTHGVVQHTADLDYRGQSGALNEHFSDVFGSLVEQRLRGQDAGTASWLIGDEVMAPELTGEALRSMAHPGSAYDNPMMGRDPQPAHLRDYYAGPEDNGGVHINSGIPNRAFYLAAQEIGSEDAGRVWYAALVNLWPSADFADAAGLLAAQARLLARDGAVSPRAATAVRAAFRAVGVVPAP